MSGVVAFAVGEKGEGHLSTFHVKNTECVHIKSFFNRWRKEPAKLVEASVLKKDPPGHPRKDEAGGPCFLEMSR